MGINFERGTKGTHEKNSLACLRNLVVFILACSSRKNIILKVFFKKARRAVRMQFNFYLGFLWDFSEEVSLCLLCENHIHVSPSWLDIYSTYTLPFINQTFSRPFSSFLQYHIRERIWSTFVSSPNLLWVICLRNINKLFFKLYVWEWVLTPSKRMHIIRQCN